MLALLDWIYGPNGYGDQYYLLMRDFLIVMPWWYGYFWLTMITGFFGFRYLRKAAVRHATVRRARQVESRTKRIIRAQKIQNAVRLARRAASNDNACIASDAALAG